MIKNTTRKFKNSATSTGVYPFGVAYYSITTSNMDNDANGLPKIYSSVITTVSSLGGSSYITVQARVYDFNINKDIYNVIWIRHQGRWTLKHEGA